MIPVMIASEYLLACELRDRLREAFTGITFREPTADGNPLTDDGRELYREPRFFIGNLKAKETDEEQGEDLPYVLIKTYGGRSESTYAPQYLAPVDIVYAVYVPEFDPEAGVQDLSNMGLVIASTLLSKLTYCGGRYEHIGPLENMHGTGKTQNPYESGMQTMGDYYHGMISTFFLSPELPKPRP